MQVEAFFSANCSKHPSTSDNQSSPLSPNSVSTTSEEKNEEISHISSTPSSASAYSDRSKLCGSGQKSPNLGLVIVVILLVLVIICQFGAIVYLARRNKMLGIGQNDLIPLTAAGAETKNAVAVQEEMEVNEMYNECPQERVAIEEMYAEINEHEI